MALADPVYVKAIASDTTKVKVSWLDPNLGAGVINFKLESTPSPFTVWSVVSAAIDPTADEYEVSGLSVFSEYKFRVTAIGNPSPAEDSGAAESNIARTQPNSAGWYWGARKDANFNTEPPTEWNVLLNIRDTSPYFRVDAFPLDFQNGPEYETNLDYYFIGPAATKPTFSF